MVERVVASVEEEEEKQAATLTRFLSQGNLMPETSQTM
jgi:hypothetical protein